MKFVKFIEIFSSYLCILQEVITGSRGRTLVLFSLLHWLFLLHLYKIGKGGKFLIFFISEYHWICFDGNRWLPYGNFAWHDLIRTISSDGMTQCPNSKYELSIWVTSRDFLWIQAFPVFRPCYLSVCHSVWLPRLCVCRCFRLLLHKNAQWDQIKRSNEMLLILTNKDSHLKTNTRLWVSGIRITHNTNLFR